MEDKRNFLFRYWTTHSLLDLHVGTAVVSIVLFVIAKVSGQTNYQVISDVLGILLILHYFIHGFYYRQYRFISDNQRVYSMPRKKIGRISAVLLAGFMGMICVGMALAKELYTGTLLGKLKALVMYVLGLIFGSIFQFEGLNKDNQFYSKRRGVLGVMDGVSSIKGSFWDNLLNTIQSLLIIIGLAGLLLLCLSLLIHYIKTKISGIRMYSEQGTALDVSDQEVKLTKGKNQRRKLFDFSPEARIRSLYRKSIRQHKKQKLVVAEWMTPAEIETLSEVPSGEYYETLHILYEKSRYSQQGCSADEFDKIKSLKP